jgi:hypothetical protein
MIRRSFSSRSQRQPLAVDQKPLAEWTQFKLFYWHVNKKVLIIL